MKYHITIYSDVNRKQKNKKSFFAQYEPKKTMVSISSNRYFYELHEVENWLDNRKCKIDNDNFLIANYVMFLDRFYTDDTDTRDLHIEEMLEDMLETYNGSLLARIYDVLEKDYYIAGKSIEKLKLLLALIENYNY